MAVSTLPPVSRQAAANCDRFEALIVGSRFQIVARHTWRLLEVYTKVGPDTVEASDGRRWPFAGTSASGASVILVPEGAFSVGPYDCDRSESRPVLTIKQEVLNARTADPFGITRLAARKHKTYNGPVYRLRSGSLWILYNDEPLQVIYLPSSEGWTYAEVA